MEEAAAPAQRSLRERLGDANDGIRLGAAAEGYLLPEPPTDLRDEFAALLTDPVEDARKLAVLTLGRIGPSAFPDLARALDASQPPAVRAFACQSAGSHGPAAAPLARPIGDCLSAPEEIVRSAASIALSRIGRAAVPDVVRAIDGAPGAGPLVAAADAAGGMGKEAAACADALRRAAGHPDPTARLACADALGRVTGRPARALSQLVAAARSGDEDVRAGAVRRIGALQKNGRGATETLFEKCADESPRVRAAAAIALALVGVRSERLLDALGKLVEDPDGDVMVAAAAAAGHLRGESAPLLPRLERLRAGPDPRPAAAAAAACEAIEASAADAATAKSVGEAEKNA
jgi:HEAT repeat protein